MFTTLEEVQKYVRDHHFQMIDLKFSDLHGRWHHVTVPACEFNAQLMRDGVGLDGIQRQLVPRELGFGPIDQNIFAWNDEQRKAIKPLPSSLFEALRALENDHEFLLQGAVFDEGQIAEWIKVKMDEYYGMQNRPHPIEIAMYFDA